MKSESVKFIIIHCSDSPPDRGDTAETIHQWHLERKFSGIGYHRIILENGDVEHGRPLYWAGAHAKGYNNKSIGICLIGKGTYTMDQWKSLRILLFNMLAKFPAAKVIGHNSVDSGKECPMFDVEAWWSGL